MQTRCEHGTITIEAEAYRLIFRPDRPYVDLVEKNGRVLAQLFVYAGVHTLSGQDDTVNVQPWTLEETPNEVTLSAEVNSSIWKHKLIRFICQPGHFRFEIEVDGAGDLSQVDYFGGYYSAQLRWGSGYFWSGQNFIQGFNPEPNTDELNYFGPGEGNSIDLTGVPLPGKDHWFFTPPPFFYAFQGQTGWLGMGVEAAPGQNSFGEFNYRGRRGSFTLSVGYEGHTRVQGRYRLPALAIYFGENEFEVLDQHTRAVHASCHPGQMEQGLKPDWWFEPIFCGWGSQCYLAALEKGQAPGYSRQALYNHFLDTLELHGIHPGTVVLDDKWQATYGNNEADLEKWPDLKGFIQEQHGSGRKVLLWLKAWDPEGIPAEECVLNAAGKPVSIDPTNPAFECRLRQSVDRMLSEAGYDADGFKIDFTARVPSGPGLKTYGDLWGLELLKRYLAILYDQAKLSKVDALVMTHTPHPYLADVMDMIRLNDINVEKDVNRAMSLRAQVAKIACPNAIIDTDNWPITNKEVWRKYLSLQPELGVPSLYFCSHIDSTLEPLTDLDYQYIQEMWACYRARRKSVKQAEEAFPWPASARQPQWQVVSPRNILGIG